MPKTKFKEVLARLTYKVIFIRWVVLSNSGGLGSLSSPGTFNSGDRLVSKLDAGCVDF